MLAKNEGILEWVVEDRGNEYQLWSQVQLWLVRAINCTTNLPVHSLFKNCDWSPN